MIDTKALPNGGIRIELDGKSEEMPAHIASASSIPTRSGFHIIERLESLACICPSAKLSLF